VLAQIIWDDAMKQATKEGAKATGAAQLPALDG
jgi:hypothetical protein